MKFKKALFAPAAMLLTVAGVISCGGVKRSSWTTNITPTPNKPQGKVVFWSNIYGDAEVSWIENVITEFNKVYPDIKVEYEKVGRYNEIHDEVVKTLPTPDLLPNLVVGYPDYFTTYIDRLVNLEDYVLDKDIGLGRIHGEDGIANDKSTKYEDFIKEYVDEGSHYQDHKGIYSLPFGKTTEGFFVNDTVFKANNYTVPTNIVEAMDIARDFRKNNAARYANDSKGASAPIAFHSLSNLFILMSEMFGAPYASNEDKNLDGRLTKSEAVLFNNDKTKAMVKTFKGWFDEGLWTAPKITENIQGALKYVESGFVEKDPSSIMIYDSVKGVNYVANIINKQQDAGQEVATGANNVASAHSVLSVPKEIGGTGKLKAVNQGGSIAMFNKGDNANKCAWLFYKFLTNTESAITYSLANSTIPARKSCYKDERIVELVNKEVVVTPEQGWLVQRDALNTELFNLYNDYQSKDALHTAPVNAFSAAQRRNCEQMFANIMMSTKTGAELDTYINSEFKKTYDAI